MRNELDGRAALMAAALVAIPFAIALGAALAGLFIYLYPKLGG